MTACGWEIEEDGGARCRWSRRRAVGEHNARWVVDFKCGGVWNKRKKGRTEAAGRRKKKERRRRKKEKKEKEKKNFVSLFRLYLSYGEKYFFFFFFCLFVCFFFFF